MQDLEVGGGEAYLAAGLQRPAGRRRGGRQAASKSQLLLGRLVGGLQPSTPCLELERVCGRATRQAMARPASASWLAA